jgi:hypothetical protein
MCNVMIYAIGSTIYIQSNEILKDVNIHLSSIGSHPYIKVFNVKKLNYEKINIQAPIGKYKVQLMAKDLNLEKHVFIRE